MNSPTLDLSVVIPAYNEESRLPKTLDCIFAYLQARPCRAEVLVVDDGSTDRTSEIVRACERKYPGLRLVSNGENRGKGFSVRHGMLEARGAIALFTDADLSTPIEEADKLLAALREQGYDAAIGSRAADRSLIEVLRVAEIPVRWSHDSATKVNVAADGIRMFLELLLIRWKAMQGGYPRVRKS
jgi:glycosyltransferase involved in cell wall biosynthesis